MFGNLLLATVFTLAGTASAGVLGSAEGPLFWLQPGVTSVDTTMRLSVSHLGDFSCFGTPSPSCLVLLDHAVTPAEVGQTFAITAASNTNFSAIAALLTDGIDDEFNFEQFSETGGADIFFPVSLDFLNGQRPDFRGFTVTEVDYTLNRLSSFVGLLPAGPVNPLDPNALAPFTEIDQDVTLTVIGQPTPEPGSLVLLLTGVGALGFARRRFRTAQRPPGHFPGSARERG